MAVMLSTAVEFSPVLARRGLGHLIEGLSNGDPVAWALPALLSLF